MSDKKPKKDDLTTIAELTSRTDGAKTPGAEDNNIEDFASDFNNNEDNTDFATSNKDVSGIEESLTPLTGDDSLADPDIDNKTIDALIDEELKSEESYESEIDEEISGIINEGKDTLDDNISKTINLDQTAEENLTGSFSEGTTSSDGAAAEVSTLSKTQDVNLNKSISETEIINRPDDTEPYIPSSPPVNSLQKINDIKKYVDQTPIGTPSVTPEYPFSLQIEGRLSESVQEKLLDLISHEQMGISKLDLETQLEEGRILIPRISEYAGVLIVQALRSSGIRMKLGPADMIFSTEDSKDNNDSVVFSHGNFEKREMRLEEDKKSATNLPITTGTDIPQLNHFEILDVITVSAAINTTALEAERSREYSERLDMLKQELKMKAYRQGASGIIRFSVKLTPLNLPSQYRMLVMGTAIRERH